ncbi:MAG: hypothetical protein JW940_36005 [Polyangiaceae bacterium]|nr:hypothetical protein [Polyangiaceae bacterium]
MSPVVTDEELMLAYRAGDREAFRELFRRYAPRLEPMFRKRVSDPELARDLLQQTFLQLHRARNDYREGAQLRPWLFAIALNLARAGAAGVRNGHLEGRARGVRDGHGQELTELVLGEVVGAVVVQAHAVVRIRRSDIRTRLTRTLVGAHADDLVRLGSRIPAGQ